MKLARPKLHYALCNVYINQRDAQILVNNLYFFIKWLYMFRTIISPKHVQPFNEIIKIIHKNLCTSLVYIHTAIRCTVHTRTTSNTLRLLLPGTLLLWLLMPKRWNASRGILQLSLYNHFFPLTHYNHANELQHPQDRQCTYNVTLRRVRATTVAVEKQ